jgi:hypothetical protein
MLEPPTVPRGLPASPLSAAAIPHSPANPIISTHTHSQPCPSPYGFHSGARAAELSLGLGQMCPCCITRLLLLFRRCSAFLRRRARCLRFGSALTTPNFSVHQFPFLLDFCRHLLRCDQRGGQIGFERGVL